MGTSVFKAWNLQFLVDFLRHVKSIGFVSKGQLLAKVNDSQLQAQLKRLEAHILTVLIQQLILFIILRKFWMHHSHNFLICIKVHIIRYCSQPAI